MLTLSSPAYDEFTGGIVKEIWEEQVYTRPPIRLLKGMNVVDVGAHVGIFSILASNIVEDGTVVAFEPNPVTLPYLYANLKANNIRNVQVIEVGLSDRAITAALKVNPSNLGNSEIVGAYVGRHAKVSLIRYDSLKIPFQDIGLVKIDVEGLELQVLRGFGDKLANVKQVAVAAYHWPLEEEHCMSFLSNHGFKVTDIGGFTYGTKSV